MMSRNSVNDFQRITNNNDSHSLNSCIQPLGTSKHTTIVISNKNHLKTSSSTNESDLYFKQNVFLNNKYFLANTNFYNSPVIVVKPPQPPIRRPIARKYENLCENCNKIINDKNCCKSIGKKQCSSGRREENIYENVCENCSNIYSGEKCLKCFPVRKPSNLFTGIFSTFRNKSVVVTTKPPIKPIIVHNVDSVFKTNKSFDLNEIVRMKNNSHHQEHIYGKLRKSDDNLLMREKQQENLKQNKIKSSKSESNFSKITEYNILPARTHSAQHLLYDNLDIIYSSISPTYDDDINNYHHTTTTTTTATTSTTTNESVIAWMTSLKSYTEDYFEEFVCNVKCIPSNSFTSCCGFSSKSSVRLSHAYKQNQSNLTIVAAQLRSFKSNLMENTSKRKAIYFKELQETITTQNSNIDPIYIVIKNSYLENESEQKSEQNSEQNSEQKSEQIKNDLEFVTTNTIDIFNNTKLHDQETSFLRPKNIQYLLTETALPNALVSTKKQRRHRHSKKKLKQLLTQLALSISLNKAFVLTYDDKQLYVFLNNFTNNTKFNQISAHYNKYLKYFISNYLKEAIEAPTEQQNSEHSKLNEQCSEHTEQNFKETICDFEIKPKNIQHKKEIIDFHVKLQRQSPIRRRKFEDFEKNAESLASYRQLSDFKMKTKKEIIMTHTRVVNDDGDNEENIYQPIWNLQTVGYGKEESIYDQYEQVDEIQEDSSCAGSKTSSVYDSNEYCDEIGWEVAEEFSFSQTLDEQPPPLPVREKFQPIYDPYQRICVLYSLSDPKLNQLIYDPNQTFYTDTPRTDGFCYNSIRSSSIKQINCNDSKEISESVKAWQVLLRTINYIEDEEDVVSI